MASRRGPLTLGCRGFSARPTNPPVGPCTVIACVRHAILASHVCGMQFSILCNHAKSHHPIKEQRSLPDIGAKATMAPTPIQRWVCPGLAYSYSPMLPSVLAVVNVEGAHTGTTTDPLRSHPTPPALPQELHRCYGEIPGRHAPSHLCMMRFRPLCNHAKRCRPI